MSLASLLRQKLTKKEHVMAGFGKYYFLSLVPDEYRRVRGKPNRHNWDKEDKTWVPQKMSAAKLAREKRRVEYYKRVEDRKRQGLNF